MIVWKVLLLLVGLFLLGFGIVGAMRFSPPRDTLASLLAPVGLLAALVAIVLLCVPDFFAG
ncbi:MAG: hypothetical protein D6795_14025 [Deltaproteobacteria bacterium]|nr:MAG: hypothetical protein D6795_14025 [Deltaproteobacteria bacterium]